MTETIVLKLQGKRKIEYECTPSYADNALVLDSKDEVMFIPYGAIEYVILKKPKVEGTI